jgi:hypothetical protein
VEDVSELSALVAELDVEEVEDDDALLERVCFALSILSLILLAWGSFGVEAVTTEISTGLLIASSSSEELLELEELLKLEELLDELFDELEDDDFFFRSTLTLSSFCAGDFLTVMVISGLSASSEELLLELEDFCLLTEIVF